MNELLSEKNSDFSVAKWIPNTELQAVLTKQHITKLHGIQIEAIQRGLFYHQNFLVSTPSGSGKTLIAEMAVYNTLLKSMRKCLYLVPFKALERIFWNYITFQFDVVLEVKVYKSDLMLF